MTVCTHMNNQVMYKYIVEHDQNLEKAQHQDTNEHGHTLADCCGSVLHLQKTTYLLI